MFGQKWLDPAIFKQSSQCEFNAKHHIFLARLIFIFRQELPTGLEPELLDLHFLKQAETRILNLVIRPSDQLRVLAHISGTLKNYYRLLRHNLLNFLMFLV